MPSVVTFDDAPPGYADALSFDLAAWPHVLADRSLSTGRHIVLADPDGPHRIWLRTAMPDRVLAYVIVRDAAIDLRIAAMRRLDRRLAGERPMPVPAGFQPSTFQRHRLGLLLDILDAFDTRERGTITTYEIASRLIYRGMTIGHGDDWKTSSQRRRTQRLIEEAFALMEGDYLKLLNPDPAGATKVTRSK